MDGFDNNSGIIILAATNFPDKLDKALIRKGRFDKQIPFELPDCLGREEILEIHSQGKVLLSPSISMHEVAKRTVGFSGAELKSLINEAAIRAARLDKDEV